MSHPPSPWVLRGDLFLSLWRVRHGVVGTAFVDYRGGVLTYRELLAARPVLDRRRPAARITEIWVDSVASRDGGRSLWAIPKELAELRVDDGGDWTASIERRRVAAAHFRRGRRLPGRWPIRLHTSQPRAESTVLAPVRGQASVQPAHAHWEVPDDGPLGHFAGRRPFRSLVLADFEIRIGS